MREENELHVVIGLGKTGLACAKFLSARGLAVALMDTREQPPLVNELLATLPNIHLCLGKLNKELLASAKEIIVSPGLSLKEPAIAEQIQAGIPVIGDIELFVRFAKAPIIAITGSNAKSTVTSLVNHMAQKAGVNAKMGGNIGTPVLELLSEQEADLYILEISSFQLETTNSLKAKVATILNISPDHMDRYDSLHDYIKAKQTIYKHSVYQVINRDDDNTLPFVANERKNIISFGLDEPKANQFGLIKKDNKTYLAHGQECLLDVAKMSLKGRHNWLNALSALALGQAVNLPLSAMLEALQDFAGLEHRCQWVVRRDEIDWYNDSKGTNVGATIAAIDGLASTIPGKLILIAGGIAKDADFSVLKKPVKTHVKDVILFGRDANLLQQTLTDSSNIHLVDSLKEAILLAKKTAMKGDAVLFSPACASFDMFNNFAHRGEVFKQLLGELV